MSKPVFEVQLESNSIVLWEGPVGHRVTFESEITAMLQADILQQDERRFHKAKEEFGVYVIEKYGERLSPFEYLQRLFKVYRCSVGKLLGITVYENVYQRPAQEYW